MIDKRQEMIEELIRHPLEAEDGFRFRCTQCGKCCRDRNDILLSPFDLCRISLALNKTLPDVLQGYCELYVGENSRFPLAALKMREDNGKCPFLGEDDRCSIQLSKPSVCALFPLGRFGSRDAEGHVKIMYILQPTECGSKDEEHTPREWMGEFNMRDSEEWFDAWQDAVFSISEKFRDILPKMPGRSGDAMLSAAAQILYLRYHPEQPLIPQVKENAAIVGRMIEGVERIIIPDEDAFNSRLDTDVPVCHR